MVQAVSPHLALTALSPLSSDTQRLVLPHAAPLLYHHRMAVDLPPAYYLNNFLELVDHVHAVYADLLNDAERDYYARFRALPTDAQKLYVRMLSRKGMLFRASKLAHYQEINDAKAAASELQLRGFIYINPELNIADTLRLFNRREWIKTLRDQNVDTRGLASARREELDATLRVHFSKSSALALNEDLYELLGEEIFKTFNLCFFGNLHQSLTEFVLRDIGIYRYPVVSLDATTRLFQSREQIDKHLDYYHFITDLDEVLVSKPEAILAFNARLPSTSEDDPALSRRVNRVKVELGRQLERQKAFSEAAQVYSNVNSPDARERLARVYSKLDEVDSALDVCRIILAAPLNETEQRFSQSFGARLAKKHARTWPQQERYTPPTEKLMLPLAPRVEAAVAAHFSSSGTCYYSENAIFCSFFAIFYWGLIYFPFRGAFTHPFQMTPHDLYDYDFMASRKKFIGEDCDAIDSVATLKSRILENWKKNENTATTLIYWSAINEEIIDIFCDRIPLDHWRSIFKRMWDDLRSNRNGFPDLCFFPDSGGYELIEVKGPGDRLQKNQLRWMQHFSRHGIPHKVINLEWQ